VFVAATWEVCLKVCLECSVYCFCTFTGLGDSQGRLMCSLCVPNEFLCYEHMITLRYRFENIITLGTAFVARLSLQAQADNRHH
jgi:hypothetical protein